MCKLIQYPSFNKNSDRYNVYYIYCKLIILRAFTVESAEL